MLTGAISLLHIIINTLKKVAVVVSGNAPACIITDSKNLDHHGNTWQGETLEEMRTKKKKKSRSSDGSSANLGANSASCDFPTDPSGLPLSLCACLKLRISDAAD